MRRAGGFYGGVEVVSERYFIDHLGAKRCLSRTGTVTTSGAACTLHNKEIPPQRFYKPGL